MEADPDRLWCCKLPAWAWGYGLTAKVASCSGARDMLEAVGQDWYQYNDLHVSTCVCRLYNIGVHIFCSIPR